MKSGGPMQHERVHFQEDLPKRRDLFRPDATGADTDSLLSSQSSSSAAESASVGNIGESPFRVTKSHIGITSRARVSCKSCRKRCVGQVVQTVPAIEESSSGFESCPDSGLDQSGKRSSYSRLQSSFYHVKCFCCSVCKTTLVETTGVGRGGEGDDSGYFVKDDRLFCPKHYQILYGERCTACYSYLTGEIMAVLGRKYHSSCLACSTCGSGIKPNERVSTMGATGATGHDILCSHCTKTVCNQDFDLSTSLRCAGCHSADMRCGDTILAMGYSFHAWCFKCVQCNSLLDGLYFHYRDAAAERQQNSTHLSRSSGDQTSSQKSSAATPKALCPSCFYVNNCSRCFNCDGPIDPGEQRLEIGNRSLHDQVFSFHPNCAKCHNCHLCFSEGEQIEVKNYLTNDGGRGLLGGRKLFMHSDCSHSLSRRAIETMDFDLSLEERGSHTSFRRMLKTVPDQLRSHSNRRSWATPSTSCSSVENYFPKTGSQYRLSYLEPRNMATCGGTYFNSLYCRFVVASMGRVSKQEKTLHYLSLRFHEEKEVPVEPSGKYKDTGIPIYPKEVLFTMNKVMPKGVCRSKLEAHLSDGDFFSLFKMSREEFYRLPTWKQNFLKKMHNLF